MPCAPFLTFAAGPVEPPDCDNRTRDRDCQKGSHHSRRLPSICIPKYAEHTATVMSATISHQGTTSAVKSASKGAKTTSRTAISRRNSPAISLRDFGLARRSAISRRTSSSLMSRSDARKRSLANRLTSLRRLQKLRTRRVQNVAKSARFDASICWNTARSVRDPVRAWRRRDGRGVSCARRAARP